MNFRVVILVAAMLAGQQVALAASAQNDVALPNQQPASSKQYEGYYQIAPHAILRIWQENGGWFVQLSHQRPIAITPQGHDEFATVGVAAEIAFQTDLRSNVTGIVLKQNGRELSAAKVSATAAMSADPSLADRLSARSWQQHFVGPPRILSGGGHGSDYWPCFSPDGQSVVFAHTLDGQTWTLMRVSADGGAAAPIASAPMSVSATRPNWSAAAGMIAFTATAGARNQIWVMRPDGTGAHPVTASGLSDLAFYPSWYPDGRHLIAMDARDFVVRRFALDGGSATAVTDPKKVFAGMPSVSPDGRWIAFAGQKNLGQAYDQRNNVIWIAASNGSLKTLEAIPRQGRAPVWSPDGSHLAFESDRGSPDGRYAIFIIAKDGTGLTQITPYELNANHPVWSPQGESMAMTVQAGTRTQIAVVGLPAQLK